MSTNTTNYSLIKPDDTDNADLKIFVGQNMDTIDSKLYDLQSGTTNFVNVKNPPSNLTPAKGDGVTDDSGAIQAIINYVAGQGGGTIFFPRGIYILNGGYQDTSGANALLLLPNIPDTTAKPVSIEFLGEFPPPTAYPEANAMPVSDGSNASILLAKTNAGGSYPCVLGGPGGSEPWSNLTVFIKNLVFRQPNNPALQGIQLYHTANAVLENVVIDVDTTIDTAIIQPSNANGYALVLPDNSNYGLVRCTNVYIIGYYGGIQFSEHAVLDNIFIQSCVRGLMPEFGYHASMLNHILIQWCNYPVFVLGASPVYLRINLLDIEDASSGWYTTTAHIQDPSNLLHATITIHRVLQNSGVQTSAPTLSGATNATISIL